MDGFLSIYDHGYGNFTQRSENSVSVDSQLGTTSVGDFRMVPTAMKMDMHMFGLMHAISDKWTIMGMINYLDNEMDMIMAHFMEMGGMTMQHDHEMAAESSGLGDLKLVGLYDLPSGANGRRIHLNLGLSIPTGSIDEKSEPIFWDTACNWARNLGF